MQTELMLRLLRKDPASKSGYRIVGYMRIEHGAFCISAYFGKDEDFKPIGLNGIGWGAFDLGIKVNGEWWFEGDRIGGTDPNGEEYLDTIICRDGCMMLSVEGLSYDYDYTDIETMRRDGFELKRIGNIHGEEK